jgi:choline dehydrogenase-like flavoprotein
MEHIPNLIVGSGLSGRTVASHLEPGSYLILERGENRSMKEMESRFEEAIRKTNHLYIAEDAAATSDLSWNQPYGLSANDKTRLSPRNFSKAYLVGGGASNLWGGTVGRVTRSTFAKTGEVSWPLSYDDLVPYYERAERQLNLTGVPGHTPHVLGGRMAGGRRFHELMNRSFGHSYPLARAVNKNPEASNGQGLCCGSGHCNLCPMDAKARPQTIFEPHTIRYETLVEEIVFEGNQARELICLDRRSRFRIGFDRLILAANGIETPRLIARSTLPKGVNRRDLGRYYQDHSAAVWLAEVDDAVPYRSMDAQSAFELTELTAPVDDVEIGVWALMTEPRFPWKPHDVAIDHKLLNAAGIPSFISDLNRLVTLYFHIDIPPHREMRVDTASKSPRVIDTVYPELAERMALIVEKIGERIKHRGRRVRARHDYFMTQYGGHHFVGTTNMGTGEHAVVDINSKLIGTENIYCAGTSVLPRAGKASPTLTAMALAERLGEHLSR